jgi:membrane-associated phospholipid phosphatase
VLSPDVETAAPRPLERRSLPWGPIRLALVLAYAVGYVWWFFEHGIIIDRISVLLSVAFFLVVASIGQPPRRWLMMFGDLFLFVAMWIVYDESRGIADQVGFPVQVESVRNLDRLLFFGADPVVWLQDTFDRGPDNVQWYDVVGSMVYYSHFIVPPVTIAVLWFISRTQWVRYMRRFATVLFIACAMFVLLPTAPPWMAAGGTNRLGLELDALPPLSRPTGRGWRHIGLDAFVKAWDHGRDWANQVAAMPSLHSAFAMFIVLFCFQWVKDWRWRALLLLYPLSMAVALMYFAEHYFVDALAGWAVVFFSFWLWDRIERKWDARRERLAAEALLEEIDQKYDSASAPDRALPEDASQSSPR